MTLTELADKFRANQIQVTEETLGRMIVEGKLPFAVGLDSCPGRKKSFLIFRHAFYEWLEEMAGTDLNERREG